MTDTTRPAPMVGEAAHSFRTARVAPEEADFRPALPLRSWPGVNGTHMGKMTYREQLLHPNWQRRRLEILSLHGFRCAACEAADKTLHVHHKAYVKGRMVWEYGDDELTALCVDCHASEHANRELLDLLLATCRVTGVHVGGPLERTIGMLAGYYVAHFAGEYHEEACQAAYELAPEAFRSGMVAAGLIAARSSQVASLVRGENERSGFPISAPLAKLVADWLGETPPPPEGGA